MSSRNCKDLFRLPPIFRDPRLSASYAVTWAVVRFFTPRRVSIRFSTRLTRSCRLRLVRE
jgi:hypothetical protein